jgi:hypothetical protein
MTVHPNAKTMEEIVSASTLIIFLPCLQLNGHSMSSEAEYLLERRIQADPGSFLTPELHLYSQLDFQRGSSLALSLIRQMHYSIAARAKTLGSIVDFRAGSKYDSYHPSAQANLLLHDLHGLESSCVTNRAYLAKFVIYRLDFAFT